MDKLRYIIREELKIIINSDENTEQIDFGPALGRAIETLIEIQDTLKKDLSDSQKLDNINAVITKFF